MKRYITAQAMKQSDISDSLESTAYPVMEAIAQLYLFPRAVEKNHWRKEVWANFHEVPVLKRTHKPPKADFIYRSTWEENKQYFDYVVDSAITHEYQYQPDANRLADLDSLLNIMETYFKSLCDLLAKNRYVKSVEVYKLLDDLGL